MKKDIAKVFLRTLLLVSMLSLSFPIGETVKPSSSESLYIAGKVVETTNQQSEYTRRLDLSPAKHTT